VESSEYDIGLAALVLATGGWDRATTALDCLRP